MANQILGVAVALALAFMITRVGFGLARLFMIVALIIIIMALYQSFKNKKK